MDIKDLRGRCDEIDLEGDPVFSASLVASLKKSLRESDEVATAAPLEGTKARVFCMKFAGGDIRAFVNPMVVGKSGVVMSDEHQIGVSPKRWIAPRFRDVDIAYQTPTGKPEVGTFKGPAALVMQQMVDLLDGVLLEDFALEVLDGWDNLPSEDRKAVFKAYLDSLAKRKEAAEEAIEDDPEAKAVDGEIGFVKAYYEGKVETMPLTPEESAEYESAVKADAVAKATEAKRSSKANGTGSASGKAHEA